MRSVVATAISDDDPRSGLAVIDVADVRPTRGRARVDVRAAALNHHDLWTLRGVGVRPEDLPVALGTDAAGVASDGSPVVVHAVMSVPGPDGDETLARDFHLLSERGEPGALTEAILVPERCLIAKPVELSWAEAACLPTAYLTAYRMITTKARLASGARMLVQGVGGGVATAAIVVGRALGIEVHATGRTAQRRAQAEALGATAHEAGARLPAQVDAVIETVGAATWGHSLRSLRTGGCVVVAGATTGGDPPAELARVFWRGISIHGTSMGTREELVALLELLVRTGVRPVIDSVHPLADVAAAFARLESGEAFGKVVVEMPSD